MVRASVASLLFFYHAALNAGVDFIGEAFSLNSGDLLYTEHHVYSPDGMSHEIIYKDDAGIHLAEKLLDYQPGDKIPNFLQENLSSNTRFGVTWQGDDIVLLNHSANKPRETIVDAPSSLVIDAGFDAFIREHWQSLVDGNAHSFYFAIPARSSLAKLSVRTVSCREDSASERCFKLEMDNWLLRMIVDPIELAYEDDTRRLSRYRGLANIEDSDGNAMEVEIRYRYPEHD